MTEEQKEKKREACRKWYDAHAEEKKAYLKAWRAAHPEQQKAYKKARRDANPEKVKAIEKASKRKCRFNYLDLEHYKWEDVLGFDGWTVNTVCHHILEEFGYSAKELKEKGLYYNRPADELVCLTNSQHSRRHADIRKFFKK